MATLQLSPSFVPVGSTSAVKILGIGTAWTTDTASLTGGTGASIASQSTDSTHQSITASVVAGSVAGPLTINVGSLTITLHVGTKAKHLWFNGLARRWS